MTNETPNRNDGSDANRSTPREPGSLSQSARDAGDKVTRQASSLAHSLMDEAGKQVEHQRAKAADRVAGVAEVVQEAAHKLAEREPWLGRWIEQGADGIHGFADTVRDRDPRDLLDVVTDFARRQPAWFAGAAVAVGFAVARATRGSIEGDPGSTSRGYGTGGDYERADWRGRNRPSRDWQDRDWQGPSPGHAHDDPDRPGGTASGLTAANVDGIGTPGASIRNPDLPPPPFTPSSAEVGGPHEGTKR